MGLRLQASCGACGAAWADLRLGGTHEMIARHDVAHFDVFATPCCRDLQSVEVVLGQGHAPVPCARCGVEFTPSAPDRYRISRLRGEVLEGHPCPRCGAAVLGFEVTARFV